MIEFFGLGGVSKTRLLKDIANYYKEINPEMVVYISKDELKMESEKAIK